MQSILIVGKNKEKVREKAKGICDENNISKFDIVIIETEKAVGIGDIRALQKKIYLKPLQSEKKAVILESFLGMTVDSQNAFLKVLEEPPANTIIIMLASSLDFVLPTILSRCNLITLDEQKALVKEDADRNLAILLKLKNNDISFALKIAQDNSKDREVALNFLEGLIITVEKLLEKEEKDFFQGKIRIPLKNMQKTYTIIKTTNISPRLALENLFLNLFLTR